ncbi:uncharacterized protein LAESUDRAFT_719678 [Laetiporus sulphureus 93-53]|uniref:BCAS3 WD40 domain-containing protein n=1 Tax=Laetiporus sulphureus 93-53 TaxID=1314785 RepID=A0A165IN91_9APHY|nr:uncharacterized protein LAESUDRAFT_719678 [Laetiporus sulphureus 93-53]KZT13315.1 hypothetical protein LAESUDRAFT_719678 [Laetiporus sulphureus 93-53]
MLSKEQRNAHSRSRHTTPPSDSCSVFDDYPTASYSPARPSPSPPPEAAIPEPVSDPNALRKSIGELMTFGDVDDPPGRVSGEDDLMRVYEVEKRPVSPPERSNASPADDAHVAHVSTNVGHTRAPMLAREPTTLETFSRTIRQYVPSSIPIPSATPSPPRVSRPVSFGSFLTPLMAQYAHEAGPSSSGTYRRRASDATIAGSSDRDWGGRRTPGEENAIFDLDEELPPSTGHQGRIAALYPGVDSKEEITWAGWDQLVEGDPAKLRRVLMLGYHNGLQVWDCSDLGSVTEILNLSGDSWGSVELMKVLPSVMNSTEDKFRRSRPLMGVLSSSGDRRSLLIYSLRTHAVVQTLTLPGLCTFSASNDFVVLSAASPPTISILSSSTFRTLYTISSASIAPFAIPSFIKSTPHAPTLDLDGDPNSPQHMYNPTPQPVFALSNRLLAFVAPLAPTDLRPVPSITHLADAAADAKLGLAQVDLGQAAVKIGGSVLHGMKSLGGMAIAAAKAGVSAATSEAAAVATKAGAAPTGLTSMFFSRSAPTASVAGQSRRSSISVPPGTLASPSAHPSGERRHDSPSHSYRSAIAPVVGGKVVVFDLKPLLVCSPEPDKIADFIGSKHQPISSLRFSANGTSLAMSFKDGRDAKIYRLRPIARALRALPTSGEEGDQGQSTGDRTGPQRHSRGSSQQPVPIEPPWHVYSLRRGRTSAIVEDMDWSNDARWFAIGTRARTVHVFAVNPYGGRPDEASHLSGRVMNTTTIPPLSTEVHSLIRMHMDQMPSPQSRHAPLAFQFIRSSSFSLPSSLLPPTAVTFSTSSSPSSVHSTGQTSPTKTARRLTNYQDVLLFDPCDGTLSLRRFFIDRHADEHGSIGSIPIGGSTSMSLPGMNALARVSTSPVSSGTSPQQSSTLNQVMEKSAKLVARETRVGTWYLRRGRDWPEVKQVLRQEARQPYIARPGKTDWLSCAELSTHSASPRILPRSIYLSHQFSFYSLGEDYHAVIRSHHFDVPAARFEVRKRVEVNAYPAGFEEGFVQDLGATGAIGRTSSSFDGPLASALSAEMSPMHPSTPILPMFPNGAPGSTARSFRRTIPIRNVAAGLGDSMSGGLGRLRREIRKTRSPRLTARPDDHMPSSVPLEFDEEDEDFLFDDVGPAIPEGVMMSRSVSRGEGDSGESVSTPSSTIEPLPLEDDMDDMWRGWDPEDQQAIEDAEQFDDITMGLMDEEQSEADKKRYRTGRIVHRT